jgi:hypothetical protein
MCLSRKDIKIGAWIDIVQLGQNRHNTYAYIKSSVFIL